MCSCLLAPAWQHEDHLVDAHGLVAAHQLARSAWACRWRRAASPGPCCISFTPSGASSASMISRGEALQLAVGLELLPDVRDARRLLAHTRSSGRASSRRSARRRCRGRSPPARRRGTSSGARTVTLGFTAKPAGTHSSESISVVVLVHPLASASSGSTNENDSAPMPVAGGEVDRLPARAGHPQRRVGLLQRLGHHVARRHPGELGSPSPANGSSTNMRVIASIASIHMLALARPVDQEAAELRRRRGLAGAEVHPAVGDEVERGDPFGDPRGMVHRRRDLHDSVPEADVLRALAGGRQEHLGRRGVRVLLEEVVLDLPGVVEDRPGRRARPGRERP